MISTRDVIFRTANLDDAKAFYNGVLGFPVVASPDRVVGFDTGSITMYFESGDDNGAVFEYEVDDINATKTKLLAQGCTLVEENPAIPRCYLRDRFGVIFNLSER